MPWYGALDTYSDIGIIHNGDTGSPNTETKQMEQSSEIGALAGALAKAQLEVSNPEFDAVNPHFKNRYASLAAHTEALRKPLAQNGLAIVQSISTMDNAVSVTTRLIHSSGQWMSDSVAMALPERATAQQLGSFVTYLRRYSLAAFGLVVGEPDDDGEEDRNGRTFKPAVSKAGAGKPASKPTKPSDDFLSQAAPIATAPTKAPSEELIGVAWADEILDRLAKIKRNPAALLSAIESQGFDTSNGIAGLPVSLLSRVEAWVSRAIDAYHAESAATAEADSPESEQPTEEKPSRLDTLRSRRSAKGG